MKALRSAFRNLAKRLCGDDRPKPRGIWTYDMPAISDAAGNGDLKEMRRLLEKYDLDQLMGMMPLLHVAAVNGRTGVINLLLDRGASPDAPDVLGRTPLEIVAHKGAEDMVEFLLKKGARLNLAGHAPLKFALGLPRMLTLLLDRGASPDAADAEGMTALMDICTRKDMPEREACAALLLDRDARLDMALNGKTALAMAKDNGFNGVAALIEKEEAERQGQRLRRDVAVRRLRLRKKGPSA